MKRKMCFVVRQFIKKNGMMVFVIPRQENYFYVFVAGITPYSFVEKTKKIITPGTFLFTFSENNFTFKFTWE